MKTIFLSYNNWTFKLLGYVNIKGAFHFIISKHYENVTSETGNIKNVR